MGVGRAPGAVLAVRPRSGRRSRWRRIALAALALSCAAWLWPVAWGGGMAVVTIRGTSMESEYQPGDLVVVHAATGYHPGDVVAYHSRTLHAVVMHRIVARDGAAFVFKGDNNPFLDPEHPRRSQLIGTAAVRIPQGGVWLERLTSPAGLAVMAFALSIGGWTTTQRRRRRHRTRTQTGRHDGIMHLHLPHRPSSPDHALPTLPAPEPSWLRPAATGAAVFGILGLALGAVAWTRPVTAPVSSQVPTGRSMTFSYSADVPPSSAYDGTSVTSPDPVFRKLVDTVDLHLAYQGGPGSLGVNAELASASGWHYTVPLLDPAPVTGDSATTVALDLAALDERALAGAVATGMPTDQLTVDIVATVQSPDLPPFESAMPLSLSAAQLRLMADSPALTVPDPATVSSRRDVRQAFVVMDRAVPVTTARGISAVLVLGSLVVGAALLVLLRRTWQIDEDANLASRYASLVVAVEPLALPADELVVDVTEFATLAKYAERLGLLIMHWTRDGVGTFEVEDAGTTYRYTARGDAGSHDAVGHDPAEPPRSRGRAVSRHGSRRRSGRRPDRSAAQARDHQAIPSWSATISQVGPRSRLGGHGRQDRTT